jgi:hypothetical protein
MMIDLSDYDVDELTEANRLLIRIWGSSDTIELGRLLDDLMSKIESRLGMEMP